MVSQYGFEGSQRKLDPDSFRWILDSVGSYHPDLIFVPKVPVYHYTDLGGLHGIITNDDLWLTNSRYSNDEEEPVLSKFLTTAVDCCLALPIGLRRLSS